MWFQCSERATPQPYFSRWNEETQKVYLVSRNDKVKGAVGKSEENLSRSLAQDIQNRPNPLG